MGKDKNAPKRAMSAWMLFANSKRASVQKANPNLSMVQITPLLSELWKKASASEKKKFEDKAAVAKKKYQIAMEKYKKTPEYAKFQDQSQVVSLLKKVCKDHGMEAPRGKKARFPKDPNAPKRAQSAFFLWANDNRASLMKKHNNNVGAVGKALGEMWKTTSDSQKAKYVSKAEKNKAAYQTKINAYKKTNKFKKYEEARKAFGKAKTKLMRKLAKEA